MQTSLPQRLNRRQRLVIIGKRLLAQRHRFLWIFFLHRLQPEATAQTTLRGPGQIQTLVILRALLCVVVKLRRLFELPRSQSDIAETRAGGGTKTAHLAQTRNRRQAAARRFQRILEVLARRLEITIHVVEPAHSEFVTGISNGDAILIQLLLRFE